MRNYSVGSKKGRRETQVHGAVEVETRGPKKSPNN